MLYTVIYMLLYLALTLFTPHSVADRKGILYEKVSVTNTWTAVTEKHQIHDSHQMN